MSTPEILKRGTLVYYVGSASFASGVALLAAGVVFVMMQSIHYGSEPEKIILASVLLCVGTTGILASNSNYAPTNSNYRGHSLKFPLPKRITSHNLTFDQTKYNPNQLSFQSNKRN